MIWAGTGVLWTVAGGVPRSLGLIGEAMAAESRAASPSCRSATAMSASTSRPIPNALGTLEEAIDKVKALPAKPAFMIHTGDITHLSKPAEFDDADRIICRPGSTCIMSRASTTSSTRSGKPYLDRYGKGTKGAGWYQLRPQRRAFHRPRQCGQPQGRRPRQSRRRAARLARRRPQGPLGLDADRRVRAHSALDGLSGMGLGHRGWRARARLCSSASAR